MQYCVTWRAATVPVRSWPKPVAAPSASMPPSPTPMAYFSAVALMIAPSCLSAAVKAATDLLLGAGAALAD